MQKVAFCTPVRKGGKPTGPFIAALEASLPHLETYEHYIVVEGGPYISHNRATMLRKALDKGCEVFCFLDDDMSWDPQDLQTLIEAEGECVAGLYRFKKDEETYMGVLKTDHDGFPRLRKDGLMHAEKVPAGFLKLTLEGVRRFMRAFPELIYGDLERPSIDLFNHGVHKGVWYGEDYAFSRRFLEAGGEIAVLPNLNLVHHGDKPYPGNFHEFMTRQPGGSQDPLREAA